MSREYSFEHPINVIYNLDSSGPDIPADADGPADWDWDPDREASEESTTLDSGYNLRPNTGRTYYGQRRGYEDDSEGMMQEGVRKSARLRGEKAPYVRTSASPEPVMHKRRRTSREPPDDGRAPSVVSYKSDPELSTVIESSDEEKDIEDDGHVGPRSPVRVYKVPAAFRTGTQAKFSASSVSPGNSSWRGGASSSSSSASSSVSLSGGSAKRRGGLVVQAYAGRGRPPKAPSMLQDELPVLRAEFPDDRFEVGYRRQVESGTIRWGFRCLECPGQPVVSGGVLHLCAHNMRVHLQAPKHCEARLSRSISSTACTIERQSSKVPRGPARRPPTPGPSSPSKVRVAATAAGAATEWLAVTSARPHPANNSDKLVPTTGGATKGDDIVAEFLQELGLSPDLAGVLRSAGITDRVRMQGLGRLPDSMLEMFQRRLEEAGLDLTASMLVICGLQKYAATVPAST
ncbi:hypothetical protein OH77DRAFT_811430 [Trametes cingulata]|nr:hypothetical protein OH77DRAFT_811430 [Trametes cingulata]